MDNPVRVITISLVIVVTLLVGTTIADSLVQVRSQPDVDGEVVQRDAAQFSGDGEFVALNDKVGTDETVYKTTGFAVNLTGAEDSEVSTSDGVSFDNDTSWHVSVWGHVDSGAGADTMTLASVSDGELIVYYNGTADEWAAWYFRADTRNSYEVAVPASGNEVGNYTNIQVRANDTELRIYRNNTLGETADITVDNTVDSPTEAGNWDGRIEELRTFGEPLNDTLRGELLNQPAQQQPDVDRTSRLMFDDPADQEIIVLLQNGEATVSNGTLARQGFNEQVMDPKTSSNDLTGETDYEFDTDGPSVRVASPTVGSSELAGAPVAYVDYTLLPVGTSITEFTGWFSIAGLIPLVLIVALTLSVLRD